MEGPYIFCTPPRHQQHTLMNQLVTKVCRSQLIPVSPITLQVNIYPIIMEAVNFPKRVDNPEEGPGVVFVTRVSSRVPTHS